MEASRNAIIQFFDSSTCEYQRQACLEMSGEEGYTDFQDSIAEVILLSEVKSFLNDKKP